MEIEAKFALPEPEIRRRLQATDQIAGFTLSSNGIKHMHDIYLDTRMHRILAAGYSCRYREQDDGVLITIKPLQTAEGAIHRRQELEAMIPASRISAGTRQTVAEWPESVRDQILSLIGDEPLVPLVDLNHTRVSRLVKENERPVAEMSLDTVCANAAEHYLAFFELEVELMPSGTEEELAKLAAALQRDWKLRPERRSKFERALALLQDPPSSTGLLTAQEREICLRIAAHDRPDRRRAKTLLLLDEGATLDKPPNVPAFRCDASSIGRSSFGKSV